ncbi:MAG: methyltransferase [Thermoplasmatales archaeon]
MTEVKKQLTDNLAFDKEGFRMSTPLIIAKYKAERLKSKEIADLGAGIGIQALNFALVSDRVIAVENDARRVEYLKKNAEIMNIRNLDVIEGNAFDPEITDMVSETETVHSDPSRRKAGERWSFEDLSPNPLDIIRTYKSDNLSFDLPPLFPRELIPNEWELEYISLSGELKRLSAYVGKAKKFGRNALSLPGGERVVENPNLEREIRKRKIPEDWIYEIDGSLYYSGLIPEFLKANPDLSLLHEDRQKTLVTSNNFVEGHFLTKSYFVNDSATNNDDLKRKLSRMKAGKVIIRFSVDPARYYEEKRNLEKELKGEKTVYLFSFESKLFLAERVEKETSLEKVK